MSAVKINNLVGFHGPVLHVQVPDFDGEVITSHHVSPAVAELDVGYGGDDFREERPAAGVFRLLENFRKNNNFEMTIFCVVQITRNAQLTFYMPSKAAFGTSY